MREGNRRVGKGTIKGKRPKEMQVGVYKWILRRRKIERKPLMLTSVNINVN